MAVNTWFISVDDHVQEHPQVWTKRLDRSKWGDRIPHIDRISDGNDRWVVDGHIVPLQGAANCGATMPDRTKNLQHWSEVPASVYEPTERLKIMDGVGLAYSVLYPTVAGSAGQSFGRIGDPDLELACVQAYNDWLLEEWASVSDRFIPQCIVPLFPIDAV